MRSLGRQGIRTVVASEHDRIPHFASRFCDERVRIPASPDDLLAYRDALLDLAKRPDVRTIVPVRECDVYLFARYREAFEREVSLVAPPLETLASAHDRLRLAEAAADAGVPVPETRLLSDVEEWDANVVIKPRYNILTDAYLDDVPPETAREVKNVRFLTPGEEPDTAEIRAEMGHDPIVQTFVPQAEKFLYCALWNEGEPVATYQHRQIRQNSWVGGGGVYRESTHSQAVEDAAHDLLSHLDWHGFACVEYVRDERTGEWKFLEINPRVWQSMPEAVRAGADFPYYYWLCARGRPEAVDHDYETGVSSHIAYGELAHLRSVLDDDSPFLDRPSYGGTLWEIAKSCVTDPRFDYIRLDDPGLFLSALRETLSSGVTSSREYNTGGMHIRGSPGEPEQSD
ncbi:carboxylate--amine ligase [Halosimplex pelagicum]|uniref:Carboxylate--amine ligase n=2 Tax=Halosimplex pelagicum TaxID=869886 RepID=A0A7D5PAM9_9EURY|nr:carboxylate--amine ligase [Halosimplex pelagicum]